MKNYSSSYKRFTVGLLLVGLLVGGCKLDYLNPNNPNNAEVLNTREGLITHAIGVKQYYSISGIQALVTAPGTTSRELKGITTFTNILELEAGGTALPTFNGNILGYWTAMYRTMLMAENLITNAPTVLDNDPATQAGIVAWGHLFKAMALGGLATAFERFPLQADQNERATFSTRVEGLQEAVRLLDAAVTLINTTAPSAEFTNRVVTADMNLSDCLNAYRARYNMMLGQYSAAITAANAVNLTRRSQFVYNNQSPNPIFQQVQISINFRPRDLFGLPAALVDANDGRLSFYLSNPSATVNGETLRTLTGFYSTISSPIPVYLPDEMRLIRAEAILRNNGVLNDALQEINAVRTQSSGDPFGVHANLPIYSGAVTRDDLLLEVYRQRSAELFLQGLRLEDSRRFNRTAPPTNQNPVPISFERNRNFYPYPDQERVANPNTPNDPAI